MAVVEAAMVVEAAAFTAVEAVSMAAVFTPEAVVFTAALRPFTAGALELARPYFMAAGFAPVMVSMTAAFAMAGSGSGTIIGMGTFSMGRRTITTTPMITRIMATRITVIRTAAATLSGRITARTECAAIATGIAITGDFTGITAGTTIDEL